MCVSRNITEGNIYKSFVLYAIPLIMSSLLSGVYNTVDAMIAGKFIGEYALGAISACGSFEALFRSFFNGFAGGFAIYVAHLFGKGDFSTLKRDALNIMALVAAVGALISVGATLLRNPIMDYMNVDAVLRKDAEIYFCVYTSSFGFSFLNLILIHIMHALGVTAFSFYASLGTAILNIVGNLLTVLVFDMGVAGLATSTVISVIAATVLYALMIRRAFLKLPTERAELRFEPSSIKNSLRYTLPAAVQQVAFHGVGFLIAPMINGIGAAASAGYDVSVRLYNLFSITLWNITSAMNCYIAQCVGMGSYQKISKGLRVGFLLNAVFLLPPVAASVILSGPIVSLFFPAGYVGEAYGYAVRYAAVFIPFLYMQMIGHVMHSYMRSLGKVNAVLAITVFGSLVRVLATALLVPYISMDGVYIGQVISWSADATVSVLLYIFLYRTQAHIKRAVREVHSEKNQDAHRLRGGFKYEGAKRIFHGKK